MVNSWWNWNIYKQYVVTDPRFPWGGAAYCLANFSQKLHENEEILDQGDVSLEPPRFVNNMTSTVYLDAASEDGGITVVLQKIKK